MAMVNARIAWILPIAGAIALSNCGCVSVSNKITGTPRAGSEQLLLTGVSDRAVGTIDFRPLSGHRVFLDSTKVKAADSDWVTFSLRREMARQGLFLVSEQKEAQTVVEAAIAAYGTDEADCRFSLPSALPVGMIPISTGSSNTSALIRKNHQDAVVKLALFAYDAKTRQFVWESDTLMEMGHLERRFFGTTNISRATSQPELEIYPPRRVR